uniref:Variant surface glycoprotein 1125.2519 n=1 Tax=Trypanosoma brucei TaxID=5691 RepID=A0A1J0R8F9_9TRYP|nr:variant surface glycoprotein 1125.2519 [Trypanosoma brucei]
MKNILQAAAIKIAICILYVKEATSTGAPALPHEQYSNLCAVAEELATYAPAAATNAGKVIQQEQQLMRNDLKARIFAARNQKQAVQALMINAALITKCKSSLTALKTEVQTAISMVDAAAYLAGRIGEGIDFLADIHQSGGSNAGCLTNQGGTGVITGRTQVKTCGKERKSPTGGETFKKTKITANGYEGLSGTIGLTKHDHGTAKCHMLAKSTNTALGTTDVDANPTYIDGYIKLQAGGSDMQLEDLTNIKTGNGGSTNPHFKKAFDAVSAYKPTKRSACDLLELTLEEVKTSEQAQLIYAILGGNAAEKAYKADNKEPLKQAIAKAFEPESKFKENWLEKINKQQVPKTAAGETTGGTIDLENEEDIDKLRTILNYYSAQSIKRELTKPTASDSNPSCTSDTETSKKAPTKEDCKEHTEKGPCQDAGCKFDGNKNDGEKCFADPEAKTENKEGKDGKTTSSSTCAGKKQGECKKENGCK